MQSINKRRISQSKTTKVVIIVISVIALFVVMANSGKGGDQTSNTSNTSGSVVTGEVTETSVVETREQKIAKCFSAWDGSVRSVETYIKDNMNDPSSYEHVKTTNFKDPSSDLEVIFTEFRGKNAFGAIVKNSYILGINLDCSLEKTYTDKEQKAMIKKLGL